MEKMTVECECGQITHLVKNPETKKLHYAANPHGSEAEASGCFNCHAPLELPVEKKSDTPTKVDTKKPA